MLLNERGTAEQVSQTNIVMNLFNCSYLMCNNLFEQNYALNQSALQNG